MLFNPEDSTLIKRTVKDVYRDSYFSYDLSWLDDEVTMKPMIEYANKKIIDYRVYEIKKNKKKKKEPIIRTHQRGRPKHPVTNVLPIEAKRGRPKNENLKERNQFFMNFQAFKPIISNNTTRTARLVIVNSSNSRVGFRFYCQEVVSFHLPSNLMERLIENSWMIVKGSHMTYYNMSLKLPLDYEISYNFIESDFFTPENIAKRKQAKMQAKLKAKLLEKEVREGLAEMNMFVSNVNSYTNYQFIRNADIDYKLKKKFFYKLKWRGRSNIKGLTAEEIEEYKQDSDGAYETFIKYQHEFKTLYLLNEKKHPDVNLLTRSLVFQAPRKIKEVLKGFTFSLKELEDIRKLYEKIFEKNLKNKKLSERDVLLEKLEQIMNIHNYEPDINHSIEKKLKFKKSKLNELSLERLREIAIAYPDLFLKYTNRKLNIQQRQETESRNKL